jgi:predicted esterase
MQNKKHLISLLVSSVILVIACSKSTNSSNSSTTTTGTRYKDSLYATYTTSFDISFGSNTTVAGNTNNLKLDFYQPSSDTATKRPLVILVFGGGFTGGDKTNLASMAQRIVARGYVAACTSYRLYDGATPASNDNLKKEILMGIQDVKATIRFFKKDAATTNTYKIDTSKIFVLGFSAGGMIALHTAYVNSVTEAGTIDANFQTIINANGGLEGTSGNAAYTSTFKAVINLSGSLLFKNYIATGDIPLLSIYGTSDNLMPTGDGSFSLPSISSISVSGSVSLQTRANVVSVSNTLYGISSGDHFAPTTDATSFSSIITFLYNNL